MKHYMDGLKPRGASQSKPAEHYRAPDRAVETTGRKLAEPDAPESPGQYKEPGDRSKDELLAVLAHELRTPLSAILAWTRMLIKGGLDPDTYARAVDSIDRNARLQARLLDDILEWSRIMRGKIQLKKQPVDLPAIIQSAIETLRPAADARGIRFVMEGLSHPEHIDGDSDRLREVIWNLLSNAIKFSFENGEVKIRLERKGPYADISVIDSGPGIDIKFLPHVFERFRQADTGINRATGGLGLGLAIVRQLVELHGGSVSAANLKSGRGAVFTIRIPAAAADAAHQH
jgi:signal transduction histidine kinase